MPRSLGLPSSSFTVYCAPAVSDAARMTAGAKLDVTKAVALCVAFSGAGNSYGGRGVVRVTL
jgi:hypothetical protein